MLPTTLRAHEVVRPDRHDDVEQVPGQERDGRRERRSRGSACRSSANSGGRVQLRRRRDGRSAGATRLAVWVRTRVTSSGGVIARHRRSGTGAASRRGACRCARSSGRRPSRRAVEFVRRAVGRGAVSRGRASTASGVCSRTMNRPACAGTRCRVSQRDHDHRGERAAARPGRRLAEQHGDPAGGVRSVHAACRADGGARAEPADEQPGDRADVGQAAPPDAEHQQRAERRRGHREGEADGAGDADVAGRRSASSAAGRRPRRRRRPGTRSRRAVAAPTSADHVLAEHAGDRDGQPGRGGQERRERAGRHQRRSSRSPPSPPTIRRGQLEHQRVGAPGCRQVGGVDAAEGAVQRRQQVEEAEQRRAPTSVVRRAARPSGLV